MSKSTKAAAMLLGGTTLAGVGATTLRSGHSAAAPSTVVSPTAIRASRIDLGNGVLLHAVERGSASGTPVILLHGLSDSWASFSRLYEHMPLDVRLISVDLRGHGESSKPDGAYTITHLAKDVLLLLDSLAIPTAHVIGHSMGSLVAQQVALLQPTRVRGLVLIGSARSGQHFRGIRELQSAVRQFTAADSPVPEAFAREFQFSTIYLPIPETFVDSAVAASLRLPARVWHGLVDDMVHSKEAAVRKPVRTLVIGGEKDEFTNGDEQLHLAAKWNARYVAFPETGHAVHWERPAEVASTLLGFIRAAQ